MISVRTYTRKNPKFKGYHIWCFHKARYLGSRELRAMMSAYINDENDQIERYEGKNSEYELVFENEKEKFDYFKEAFLEQMSDDYYLIKIPSYVGFGIYMPDWSEYLNDIKTLRSIR